jgi:hypothetical protein
MSRLIPLVVAAALLALPASASASPAQRTATATVAAENIAFTCRVLRDTHPAGFGAAFGTYRRCVARGARPLRKHPALTFTLHNLTLNTTGAVTAVDPNPGCRQTSAGCTLTIAGNATGLLGGTYSTSWTALWADAMPNGAEGFCAVATGTVTLTLPPLGTIVQGTAGRICEIGASGPNVGHTLSHGRYTVEPWNPGTSGAFRKAAGAGSVSFVQRPGPTSALGGTVSGALAFVRFRLTF